MEREHRGQVAGCGRTAWRPAARRIFMLAGAYGWAAVHRGPNVDPMRVAAQAAAGAGFIGGGATLKEARRSAVWSCTTSSATSRAAAPGPPSARGARRPRPAAVRGRRRRRGRTGHPSAQLREHGDRLREARVADRREHDAIAELLPLALSAGISRRDRPPRRGRTTVDRQRPWAPRAPTPGDRASASELARGCASRASGALLLGARACWQLARSGTATRRTVTLRACGSRVSRRSACQRRDRPPRQHARGARARAAAAVVVTNGPCRATTRAARSRAAHRLLASKRHAIPSGEDARAAADAGGRRDGRPRCEPRRTGPATVAGPQPGRRRQLRPAARRRPLGSGPAAGAAAGQRGSDADPGAA
jgi:hypothetical protein